MRYICKKYIGEKTIYYAQKPMVLDTETSNNKDDKMPICWLTSIQIYFDGKYYLFRKPSMFIKWLERMYVRHKLSFNKRIIIIVHNLSYDLSYLIGYLQMSFAYGKDDIQYINEGHKFIMYRQGGIEFRDTYSLSNSSLENWGKNLNVAHKKQVGIYDYSRTIYQDTKLTSDDLLYDKFDVLSLNDCFKAQLCLTNDTIATVPFTSTGYIRREFRKSAKKDRKYMQDFRNNRLNEHDFLVCNHSFAGGYTHNNRHLKDKIIKAKIGHRDFRSHYPSQMRCYPLPFGKPQLLYSPITKTRDRKVKWSVDDILKLYPDYSTITTLLIEKVHLISDDITMPFLQWSKLTDVKYTEKKLDNGRVIDFEGYAITYVDNHLLKILTEQYHIKAKIIEILAFKNCYLPKCLAEVVDRYFKSKSDEKIKLKQIEAQFGEKSDEAIYQNAILMHSKAGLNGTYGMMVQNPVYDEYLVNYDRNLDDIFTPLTSSKSTQECLDIYYNNKNSFLPYQAGCFITALARFELYEYIKTIGYDKVLYCDTDSIFYLKDDETEKKIEALNDLKHKNADKLGAYITDSNGNKIYYDVFESEKDGKAFKGLHSKCYGMIIDDKGKEILSATIAGIVSRTLIGKNGDENIYLTREEELGDITKEMKLDNPNIVYDPWVALDNISDNRHFKVNTGTTAKYVVERPKVVVIDGHTIETSGGCIIKQLDDKVITNCDDVIYEDDDFLTDIAI